ncbi:hypothetical protein RyT2_24040 [Pseudolactococcus yaeyamensis]
MRNQIYRIVKEDKNKLLLDLKRKGYFVAEVDSETLKTDETFINALSEAFQYTQFGEKITNLNWLDDVMRDLEWLKNDNGYVLFISNAQEIAYPYPEKAGENFSRILFWMHYWEEEISRVTGYWNETLQIFENGMLPRKFDVYLVD